jgi:hypothetical protein
MPITIVELKSKKEIAISIFLTYTIRSDLSFAHRYMSMLIHTTHPRAKTRYYSPVPYVNNQGPPLLIHTTHC